MNAQALVMRDRNHASIIIWSICNEVRTSAALALAPHSLPLHYKATCTHTIKSIDHPMNLTLTQLAPWPVNNQDFLPYFRLVQHPNPAFRNQNRRFAFSI